MSPGRQSSPSATRVIPAVVLGTSANLGGGRVDQFRGGLAAVLNALVPLEPVQITLGGRLGEPIGHGELGRGGKSGHGGVVKIGELASDRILGSKSVKIGRHGDFRRTYEAIKGYFR